MRRRTFGRATKKDAVFGIEQGTFESVDGSVVEITDNNHIRATSNEIGGVHLVWIYPTIKNYITSLERIKATQSGYPTEQILHLNAGDAVKFVVTNAKTNNIYQALKVGFAVGYQEKVMSGDFRRETELTSEVVVEEDIGVTALFLYINRYGVTAEFDLEVYVNNVRYF